VLILGAGPAGLSAAVYARRAGASVTVAERMAPGGQMVTTPHIQNYPGFAAITGFELAEAMRAHADSLGAQFVTGDVTGLRLTPGGLGATVSGGTMAARALILAMGARRRTLGIPGEAEFTGRGVSYCAVCDGAFFKGQDALIVGGGETALEDALHLAALCRRVTLAHRRGAFRASPALQARVRACSGRCRIGYSTGYSSSRSG